MSRRLLIIDNPGAWPENWVQRAAFECHTLEWGSFVPAELHDHRADLIIVVATGNPGTVIELFRALRQHPIRTPMLVVLPARVGEELLGIVAELAADFVICPTRPEEVIHRVTRILGESAGQIDAARERLMAEMGLANLVGKNPAFVRTIERIPLLARSNRAVLITGETGTGKELCARAIHHLGPRRDYPFIPIDCGLFPDPLFENEMFGHSRGAFTDAHREQRGLVAMAEGGTLFLDEIDSLSPSSQAKLLRFLQERTYRPLGGDKFVSADVNVLAATNRDLDRMMHESQFRSDLFFRLNVLRLHMMPLRERRDDIPILARHFLDSLCTEEGKPCRGISPAALTELQQSRWPGNVRELYNVVQRAFVYAQGSRLLPVHLATPDAGGPPTSELNGEGFRVARARALEEFEKHYVTEALRTNGGNITRAARWAHQDRRAFGRLVKRHKIERGALGQ